MTDDRDVVLGHHEQAAGQARRGAGLFDLLVLGWALGVLVVPLGQVAPGLAQGALFWLFLLLVVVEGATGASPGKHVTGLRVTQLDGSRVGILTAIRRRPWGWLLPLQFFGSLPNAIVTAVALGVLLVMAVSTERARDGRGVHDRLAGTEVVDGTVDRRTRLVVVGLTAAAGLLGIVLTAGLGTTPPA